MRSSNVSTIQVPKDATNTCNDGSSNTGSTDSTGGADQERIPVDVETGIRQPSGILWMYYDDKGMPHAGDPWWPCDEGIASKIEAAYQISRIDCVLVENDTWRYEVDFRAMTQTNLDHPDHRCRSLRRVELT